ncbi:hypothetical protein JCM3774_000057 [Rhodotorula dairenensis]
MLGSLLTLATLVASVFADGGYGGGLGKGGGYGYGGLGAVTVAAENKKEANLGVSLKEVCYRNLYADAKAFKVKYNKEVAVTDVKHANVFLFDGKMLDENSQEFYFEEFCYKQFKVKEHNADVKKESLGVIARRQLGGVGVGGVGSVDGIGGVGVGAGSIGGVGVGAGSVSEAGSVGAFDGGVGAFDSGSFLSGYSGLDGGISGKGFDAKDVGLGDGIGGFDGIGKGGLGGFGDVGSLGKGDIGVGGILKA